jgi:hypothetical protein
MACRAREESVVKYKEVGLPFGSFPVKRNSLYGLSMLGQPFHRINFKLNESSELSIALMCNMCTNIQG